MASQNKTHCQVLLKSLVSLNPISASIHSSHQAHLAPTQRCLFTCWELGVQVQTVIEIIRMPIKCCHGVMVLAVPPTFCLMAECLKYSLGNWRPGLMAPWSKWFWITSSHLQAVHLNHQVTEQKWNHIASSLVEVTHHVPKHTRHSGAENRHKRKAQLQIWLPQHCEQPCSLQEVWFDYTINFH